MTIAIVLCYYCNSQKGCVVTMKLFDSELKVMEVLWKEGNLTASQLAKVMNEQIGWNRNTTYTVIKKLIEKKAIERQEPSFTCSAMISKDQIQKQEAATLIDKLFDGSAELFLSAYLSGKVLSASEVERLKQLIEKQNPR